MHSKFFGNVQTSPFPAQLSFFRFALVSEFHTFHFFGAFAFFGQIEEAVFWDRSCGFISIEVPV